MAAPTRNVLVDKVLSQWGVPAAQFEIDHEAQLTLGGVPATVVAGRHGDMLHVYIDLGYHEGRDVHRRLLELNAPIQAPANGYFALDPVLKSVLYRVDVPLSPMVDAVQLGRALGTLASTVRRNLAI